MSLKNKEFKEGNLAVYVMTHGPECTWLDDYCIPMELGAAKRDNLRYATRDDDGDDNISEKNGLYNELTGLYWMWKNDKHEYIGLYHYRRIFAIDRKNVEIALKTHDIILPLTIHMKQSCEKQYISSHIEEDWRIMCNTLKDMYPEYHASAKKIFSKKHIINCNMFITKQTIVDQYCSWLFPLLFSIEPKIDLNNRSNYQSRAIGFLAERLFTLWVIHNNLKIKHIPILFLENKDDDEASFYYHLSKANCLPYHTWKGDSSLLKNKHLNVSQGNRITKKVAVILFNYSKPLFYVFGRIYCKNYL